MENMKMKEVLDNKIGQLNSFHDYRLNRLVSHSFDYFEDVATLYSFFFLQN